MYFYSSATREGVLWQKKSDVYERLLKIHRPQAILEGSNSFVSGDAGTYPFPPYEGDSSLLIGITYPKRSYARSGRDGSASLTAAAGWD